MADNVNITPGTGDVVAADDIAGAKYQRVKLVQGADGTNDGDVSSSAPLQVTVANTGANTTAIKVDGSAATQPVSGTVTANAGSGTMAVSAASLPLPSGAATAAKQPALGTAGTASSDVITVQGITSMTALKVDGSAVTQPVSGTVTANAGTGSFTVAQATASNLKVDLSGTAANSTAIKVDGSAVTQPVSNVASTTGGYTAYFVDAVTTTATVSGSAGKFAGFSVMNTNSTVAWLQVFDTTGAVTLGTTTPTASFPIPTNSTAANGAGSNFNNVVGMAIANGIKIAFTTTAKGATTVSTGVSGTILYK